MPDTDDKPLSHEARQADLAPETHNDEQDDHLSQAHTVADEARGRSAGDDFASTESVKPKSANLDGDSTQDLVDHMRDMESSGRIDMGAYRGEPNMDDNEDLYGEASKLDKDLPSDGS